MIKCPHCIYKIEDDKNAFAKHIREKHYKCPFCSKTIRIEQLDTHGMFCEETKKAFGGEE